MKSIYDQGISEEERESESTAYFDIENEEEDDAPQNSAEIDLSDESLIAAAMKVVTERADILGDFYPFRVAGNGVKYVGSRTLVYELCLSIGTVNVSVNPYKKLQVAFEKVSGAVMSLLLGAGAAFLRTGYPPDSGYSGEDELAWFNSCIRALSGRMPGEWVRDNNSKLEHPNDGGVDVVVWNRIDRREGSLIFTGNCGCGKNWHSARKHLEPPSASLRHLLSYPKQDRMFDFFSLPFHVNQGLTT